MDNQQIEPLEQSKIQPGPPFPVSAISCESEDELQYTQVMLSLDDQFKIADLKNFVPVGIYQQIKYEGNIYFGSIDTQNQLLNLQVLYFLANSHGKQKYLKKFKKMVFTENMQVPMTARQDIIQQTKDIENFIKIMVSKLKHYIQNFQTIESTVNFLQSYQLVFQILKIIFLNCLCIKNSENIANKSFDINMNEIEQLNQQFPFDQEDKVLNFQGNRLIMKAIKGKYENQEQKNKNIIPNSTIEIQNQKQSNQYFKEEQHPHKHLKNDQAKSNISSKIFNSRKNPNLQSQLIPGNKKKKSQIIDSSKQSTCVKVPKTIKNFFFKKKT